ncbi:hypothetical protein GCM10027093_74190 [Paraburkholderia jirisanensis]
MDIILRLTGAGFSLLQRAPVTSSWHQSFPVRPDLRIVRQVRLSPRSADLLPQWRKNDIRDAAWPRKPVLVMALAIFVAGDVIGASANDISMMFFSRVLAGLYAATFSPTAVSMACKTTMHPSSM